VHGARREFAAVADRARIGRKLDRDPARGERRRQRFRRKQMPAGAAGREQHERRVHPRLVPRAHRSTQ
jgi:hypothetical protein